MLQVGDAKATVAEVRAAGSVLEEATVLVHVRTGELERERDHGDIKQELEISAENNIE